MTIPDVNLPLPGLASAPDPPPVPPQAPPQLDFSAIVAGGPQAPPAQPPQPTIQEQVAAAGMPTTESVITDSGTPEERVYTAADMEKARDEARVSDRLATAMMLEQNVASLNHQLLQNPTWGSSVKAKVNQRVQILYELAASFRGRNLDTLPRR